MKIKEFLPEEWGLLYAAFAFSQGIGLLSYWALPLVAGSLITGLGLSTTEVGTRSLGSNCNHLCENVFDEACSRGEKAILDETD